MSCLASENSIQLTWSARVNRHVRNGLAVPLSVEKMFPTSACLSVSGTCRQRECGALGWRLENVGERDS
jgi:hypothetical protein